jgi:hypothetical protein
MNKITIFFGLALIAVAYAGHGESYNKRHDDYHGHEEHKEYHHHPSYKFEYGVKDPHTHDHHSQWEHRDGDKVEGEYSLDEADGTKRIVKYKADKHSGFHAHVERVGHAHHAYGKHHE